MILLNFAHPLTEGQVKQIESIIQQPIDRIIEIKSQVDTQQSLPSQAVYLADQAGLSSTEWQTLPLLINPPSLNFVAVTLLAELHGRCGYFPACLRMRPVPDSVPPRYEVAEVINLQAVRDAARVKR
jgi:hypothetical protein